MSREARKALLREAQEWVDAEAWNETGELVKTAKLIDALAADLAAAHTRETEANRIADAAFKEAERYRQLALLEQRAASERERTQGDARVADPSPPPRFDAAALTRELNRHRQNGDLISETDVQRALASATKGDAE